MTHQDSNEMPQIPEVDFDSQWKRLMTKYATDFVEFFFMKEHLEKFDLERGIDTNTDDLLRLFPDYGKKGKVLPDKLFKLFEKDGSENFILIHVEVEKSGKSNVPARVFQYFIRLRELFPKSKITSLVPYIGQRVPNCYNVYEYEFTGTQLSYRFNAYVVKHQKEAELLQSQNPFALAVLACLYIIKSKKDYNLLLDYKRKLARLCFNRNYPKWEVRDFLLFINFTIALPPETENIYYHEIIPAMQKKQLLPAELNPYGAQMSTKMIWGKTMDEMLEEHGIKVTKALEEWYKQKLEDELANKLKSETLKAKKEAEAKLKAETLKKEQQIIKTIWNLHQNNIPSNIIAASVERPLAEIEKIIKEKSS